MVSDMVYFCRIKGEKKWEPFDEHPARPLKGVADLYAESRRVVSGTVEVQRSLESPIEEFVVDSKMTEGDLFKIL